MLDAFAYPISAVMKILHDLLSLWLPPDSGVVWVGSVVFLVAVVRLILLRPAWRQLWSARRTTLLQPQIRALKREHGKDQRAYLAAVRELQRSEGLGLAAGCLPLLLQVPVFLGLYHLLVAFTVSGAGQSNGLFGPEQVRSFAHAELFGVPLSVAIRTPEATLALLQPGLGTLQVALVVLPLLVIAAAATWVNARAALRRMPAQSGDENPLGDSMRSVTSIMVWMGPLGLLVGGIAFPLPVALSLYWAVNGTWTTVQTHLMNRRLDRLLPLPT